MFVTNIPVHKWYTHHEAYNFRPGQLDSLVSRLQRGDVVTVGVDYYATFFPELFPPQFLDIFRDSLIRGGVVRFKLFPDSGRIGMELIR
jgi:hypothetical protein